MPRIISNIELVFRFLASEDTRRSMKGFLKDALRELAYGVMGMLIFFAVAIAITRLTSAFPTAP